VVEIETQLPRYDKHEQAAALDAARALYGADARAAVLSNTDEIDLYGVGWTRRRKRMGRNWVPWTLRRMHMELRIGWIEFTRIHGYRARKVYKGVLETNGRPLARYDFLPLF